MSTRKTTKQFKEELKIKNPNIEVIGEYINNKTKILVKDKRCNHEWDANISTLLIGYGCPKQECIQKRKNQVKPRTTHRLGETKYNNYGFKMTIIEYVSSTDIKILFDNGFIAEHRCYSDFNNGTVETPYDKSVFGIGYFGEGKYKLKSHEETDVRYYTWHGILARCYDDKTKIKQPTYKDVTCCDEWHCFQNFAEWFDKNYYEINGETMQVDKDILIKGNKVYSPDNCIIVPRCINGLFVKNDANRGDLPIGVSESKDRKNNIYRARCNNILVHKCVHLGYYDNTEKAFYAYKKYKENHIKEVADYYKNEIPKTLYDAMYRYKVEITD